MTEGFVWNSGERRNISLRKWLPLRLNFKRNLFAEDLLVEYQGLLIPCENGSSSPFSRKFVTLVSIVISDHSFYDDVCKYSWKLWRDLELLTLITGNWVLFFSFNKWSLSLVCLPTAARQETLNLPLGPYHKMNLYLSTDLWDQTVSGPSLVILALINLVKFAQRHHYANL